MIYRYFRKFPAYFQLRRSGIRYKWQQVLNRLNKISFTLIESDWTISFPQVELVPLTTTTAIAFPVEGEVSFTPSSNKLWKSMGH